MKRILAVTYSQAGQTGRAVDSFLSGLSSSGETQISRLELQPETDYRLPWSFFDFCRALPETVRPLPPGPVPSPCAAVNEADVLVLGYPVWFLAPASPMVAFVRNLPPGALAGKDVITIATCRNMWVEAQTAMRSLIEEKGGQVISHVALIDRAPTYASLVTTPRFFLTGKRGFSSRLMGRLFPEFGIRHEDFTALAEWARTWSFARNSLPTSHFEFHAPLALGEAVGARIFRLLTVPWPTLRHCRRRVQNVYLLFMASFIVIGILLLLPPLAVIGSLPPMRRQLARWTNRLTSRCATTSPGQLGLWLP